MAKVKQEQQGIMNRSEAGHTNGFVSFAASFGLGVGIVTYIFTVFIMPGLNRDTYVPIAKVPCAVFVAPAPHGCATTTTTVPR